MPGSRNAPGHAAPWDLPAPAEVALAALPPFIAYLATLHPGLPAGDSGELIAVAATGGVAHPPGYPLFTMLAGAWQWLLPLGTVAWRLNLLSAVCAAGAAALLAGAVARASGSRVAGVAAAWAFALAAPVWKNAIVAEVFALNALLATGVLWGLVACAVAPPARSRRDAAAARDATPALAALAGLGTLALSHHHTLLLLAVPAFGVAGVTLLRRRGAGPRAGVAAGAAAIAGLLPLAWLPFAARRAEALVWGEASTLRGFLALLGRVDYGTFRLDPHQSGMVADRSHVAIFLEALPRDFGWLPLALAAIGALWAARRLRGVAVALAAYAVAQVWFFTRVGFPSDVAWLRGVVERFYVLPILVLAFLAGLGAAALLAAAARSGRTAGGLAAAALPAVLFALPVVSHARQVSQRANSLPETLGRVILASAPRDAVLFVQGDVIHNSLAYLTRVVKLRPDVTVLDQELMTYGWYVRRVRARHPEVLPDSFARAQRIALRDGRAGEGLAIARADGTMDLLLEREMGTVRSADVIAAIPAPAESLYAATRSGFRRDPFLDLTDERYSGLPGSRNLLWLDHLAGRRPAAFVGTKDDSWSLRWELTPWGAVALAHPRGAAPAIAAQAAAALEVLEQVPLDAYFGDYDATSFERVEKEKLAAFAARAALLMCQPAADAARRSRPRGHARLLDFARRFEVLDPTPNPVCLRAMGFLRAFDSAFLDPARARRALERYQATSPEAAADAEVRATLARLPAGPR